MTITQVLIRSRAQYGEDGFEATVIREGAVPVSIPLSPEEHTYLQTDLKRLLHL